MRYTDCAVPEGFVNNMMFTMKSHVFGGNKIAAGSDEFTFEKWGTFKFLSKEERREPGYDTIGFSFYKDYTVYDNNLHNLRYGLHRLFGARKDSLDLHLELEEAQLGVRNGPLKHYIDEMVRKFTLSFIACEIEPDHEQAVEKLAKMPHVKQKIRMRAWKKLVEHGLMLDELYMERVAGKLKTGEKAKPGKKPRVIGDYTTEGSLLGGYLIGRFKKAFTENLLNHRDDFIQFCDSPHVETLSRVFKRHLEVINFGATYYSDDSIYSIRSSEGILRHYCVDISSCDVSNGQAIFDLLQELSDGDSVAAGIVRRLIKQCATNLRVTHPQDRGESFTFMSKRPVEYSGSLITTVLNNIASSIIGMSVYDSLKNGAPDGEIRSRILQAAARVGYIVTVNERDDFASLQFLKNSPTRLGDSYVNLGVLLRGLGGCHGDFPGRGDLSERVENFASSVVAGYAHCGNNIITRALRNRFRRGPTVTIPDKNSSYIIGLIKGDESTVEDSELSDRYGCSIGELEELAECIVRLRVGDVINCKALDKIFNLDYEYPNQL